MESTAIVEVREESMISPAGGDANATRRTAHFLKPSISSLKPTQTFESPSPSLSPKPSRSGVSFLGWRYGNQTWKLWVEKMAATHKPTWEKAGICDAVMNSVYQIRRDDDLVFGLAEKWCSETNTFVFQWGEATLTLEDMAVFGFSVLGSPVFLPVTETEELKEIEQELSMAVKEISSGKSKKAGVGNWKSKFRDSESSIEHEAFLAAWLSRYVFINAHDSIRRTTFPIAIHLARGTRIALAPAVLASIYRDLGILKRKMFESTKTESSEASSSIVKLWSPLQFVQLWAWERFLQIQPRPNELSRGEPRSARWSMTKIQGRDQEARMILDSAATDNFVWRPYALPVRNWEFSPKFYGGKEKWVTLGSGSENDDDLVCFARCLRPSSLVGMDTIEQYLPHRVAMQFGFDQGIPGCVGKSDETTDLADAAWSDYSRALDGVRLYVPSRLFEADVTTLYQQWWKQAVVEMRSGESLSLLKRNNGSRELMDNKKKKEEAAGGGNSALLKHEEKRNPQTAAEGSGSRGLLSQKISAMSSYKNAKRKNDSNDGLTDTERLVKRLRARAYGTQVKKDGSRINIVDPPKVSEPKVVRRDVEEEEDMMSISELVKANCKHGNAVKIIDGGEVGSSSLQSSNFGEAVPAMIWESEAAVECRQTTDGYLNRFCQSSNHQLSVARDQTPGKGSGEVWSSRSQCHSFSAEEDVVPLVNPGRAATMTNVMKMELVEAVAENPGVAENENQSNESSLSLTRGTISLSSRNSEVGGGRSMLEPTLKRLDARVSELEKQVSKMKAARLVGRLSMYSSQHVTC